MSNTYVKNPEKLVAQLSRFISFVQQMDGKPGFISFRDSTGFLGREEDYKSSIAIKAREEMKCNEWNESLIGTGKIADYARKAVSKSENLVNKNQIIDFKNRLDPNNAKYRPDAERVLYDIYRNPLCDEATAFANAVEVFGAKYDTIAFLFFIKDDTRFLPISTGHFDKGFAALEIDYTTSFRCSWENYQGFLEIIKEIRTVMEDMRLTQGTPRLIDAHSFVWIIQQDRFINWVPGAEQSIEIEREAEDYLLDETSGSGGRQDIKSSRYVRNAEVVKETRRRANGICQLCNQPAPFIDKNGDPFLEVHHVEWLSCGGEDSTANTAALCPNCHKRMHYLEKPEDKEKLKGIIACYIRENENC